MKARGLAKSVGAVVGENLSRIRAERRQTQREAAAFLRERGLSWSPGNLARLELGERDSVRPEDLLLLSAAYDEPLSSWFAGTGSVHLTDDIRIARENVRHALGDSDLEGPHLVDLMLGGRQRAVRHVDSEPERAAALQLLTTTDEIARGSKALWKRGFVEERDHRVGPTDEVSARSLQAKRGHTTRALIAELQTWVASQKGSLR